MGGYGMAAKMRELTEQNMQEFVKEVEKRKIPLHSHWQSDCWSRKGKFPCRILSVIISRNICPGECILGWQR